MRFGRKEFLLAAFGVIAAAIACGAWRGFPIFADAWVPLIARERGVGALAADSADRPIFGWLLQGAVALFGFGPAQSALLTLAFWLVLAWQVARLWKAALPQKAALAWLPAMLALAPVVVRTQFKSITTLFPGNLPVMLVLAGLLLALRDGPRGARLTAAFALAGLGAAISEYGVAAAIAAGVFAFVIGRPRTGLVLGTGAAAGAIVFALMTDAAVRPDTTTAGVLGELAANPVRPFARWISGLWYALAGAWGDAASRVDLDTLSRSSILAAAMGLATAVLVALSGRARVGEPEGPPERRVAAGLLLAIGAGLVPVVLAGRPVSFGNPNLDPVGSRFLLPILPFASCLTVWSLARLTSRRGLLAGAGILTFLCGDASWRGAFDASRAARRMDALGAALRPLVAARGGITLAVVPDTPTSAFPPVVTGQATVGWPADEARRLWVMPLRLAEPHVGTRRDCRVPDELHLPRQLHTVERVGVLSRVVWVGETRTGFGEPEPYCVGRPD